MTKAEQETINTFCRELARELSRLTGKTIDIHLDLLATPDKTCSQTEPSCTCREIALTGLSTEPSSE